MFKPFFFQCLVFILYSTLSSTEREVEALSLKQALRLCQENSLELKSLDLQKNFQQLRVKEAKQAFGPELVLSSTQSYYKRSLTYLGTPIFSNPSKKMGLTLVQPLWDFRIWDAYRAVKEESLSQTQKLSQKKQELFFDLIQLFIHILNLQERKAYLQEQESQILTAHESIKKRFDLGLVDKSQKLRLDAIESENQWNLCKVSSEIKNNLLVLSQLIGVKNIESLDKNLDVFIGWVDTKSVEDLVQLAIEKRADIKAHILALYAAECELKLAKDQRLPSLSLFAQQDWKKPQSSSSPNNFWTAGLSLEWKLLNRGQIQSQIKKTQNLLEQRNNELERIKQKILVDLSQTYTRVESESIGLDHAKKMVLYEQERFTVQDKRFIAGLCSETDYLDSLVQKNQREMELVSQQQAYHQSIIDLRYFIGCIEDML